MSKGVYFPSCRSRLPTFSTAAPLKAELARLKRMQFGKSSEKLDAAIRLLEIALESVEAIAADVLRRWIAELYRIQEGAPRPAA